MPDPSLSRATRYVLLFGVIVSVLVRLPNLVSPLLDNHGFRQTQTAFTVQRYLTDGFSILHPQMPVFGPPWEVPFEFPLFQLTAAVLAKLTGLEVDLACRVTGLLFFYVSAAMLFILCRRQIGGRAAAIIVLAYLLNPFTVVWSRASLVEFAAVTFALAYVDLVLRWLSQPRSWKYLLLAIVCGSLGALTKITTMAITVPPILVFTLDRLFVFQGSKSRRGPAFFAIVTWLAITVIPVGVGQLWNHHADAIKQQMPLAQVLVSTYPTMIEWNFGTLAQRTHWSDWSTIFERIFRWLVMPSLCGMPFIALGAWPWISRSRRLFLVASLLGVLFPISLFFNLFAVHDYYLCAVSPFVAVLVGAGIDQTITLWQTRSAPAVVRWGVCAAALAIAGGLILRTYQRAKGYLTASYTVDYTQPLVAIGEQIAKLGDGSEPVIFANKGDWDPSILYYAHRKGVLMWRHEPGMQTLLKDRFPIALVVISEPSPEVLSLWRHKQLVTDSNDLQVWRVDDFVGQPANP